VVAAGGDQVHVESSAPQSNRNVPGVRVQVVIGQVFQQAPVDVFHLHAGDRAEGDQNVHVRRQADGRVLGLSARQREPQQVLLSPLLEERQYLISGAVRRGICVGNNAVFLDNRGGVLINRDHGGETCPREIYRQIRRRVETAVTTRYPTGFGEDSWKGAASAVPPRLQEVRALAPVPLGAIGAK